MPQKYVNGDNLKRAIDYLKNGTISIANENLAEKYDDTKTYKSGDLFTYNGLLYVCITQSTGNLPTNTTYFDTISIADILKNCAKVDGYYETFGYAREAGIAKNLQNDEGKLLDPDVDTSAGTVYADAPFVQRATAMSMKAYLDNELITVGSGYEQWRKEQAFSIVRNQLVYRRTSTVQANITLTIVGNKYTFSGTASAQTTFTFARPILNHRLLVYIKMINNPNNKIFAQDGGGSTKVPKIYEHTSSNLNPFYINFSAGETADLSFELDIFSLTQWFASRPAIATALTGDAGIKWFLQNYPQALTLDYDAGTIVDTEDYDYETTGVNQWDEEWESGSWDTNTGEKINYNGKIRNKNLIPVFPDTKYYINVGNNNGLNIYFFGVNGIGNSVSEVNEIAGNKIITTPMNCYFIGFSTFGTTTTTYNNDIQICNHFTETSVEQTYHKYEIFKDRISWAFTSTGKGKSAGSVADTKDYVNKKNIEKVGKIDLGTLNWTRVYNIDRYLFYVNLPLMKLNGTLLCQKYIKSNAGDSSTMLDKTMWNKQASYTDKNIIIRDDSYVDAATFKAAMSGVILNYELATYIETDMTGDELDTNIPENDYGVERKVSISGDMFSGSATTIFYQDNVLRQIYNNKSAIDNLQEDLSNETTTRSNTDSELQNAIGGTLRQCLATSKNIDFNNTAFLDLGDLQWNLTEVSVGKVSVLISDIKAPANNDTFANILCTSLQTDNYTTINSVSAVDLTIAYGIYNYLQLKWTDKISSSTDTREKVKAALKGVLLAYEKASS